MSDDLHAAGRLLRFGPKTGAARRAVVALHGRGSDGADMAGLVESLGFPDMAVFAPEAAGRSWWPTSFLAPTAEVGPYVASALSAVDRAMAEAAAEGYAERDIVLIGFSQGGCLALEWVARTGRPVEAVFGLSAGLLGTADADGPAEEALYGQRPKRFDYAARLDGIPVRVSVHEEDPHIPLKRARESTEVLARLGADAKLVVEPGRGHALTAADVSALRAALQP